MRAFQDRPGFGHREAWGMSMGGSCLERGERRQAGQPGKLAQKDFTSCDCGWVPQAAKEKGQNQDQLCVCVTCVVTKGPTLRRALDLVQCSAVIIRKLMMFEQGARIFILLWGLQMT